DPRHRCTGGPQPLKTVLAEGSRQPDYTGTVLVSCRLPGRATSNRPIMVALQPHHDIRSLEAGSSWREPELRTPPLWEVPGAGRLQSCPIMYGLHAGLVAHWGQAARPCRLFDHPPFLTGIYELSGYPNAALEQFGDIFSYETFAPSAKIFLRRYQGGSRTGLHQHIMRFKIRGDYKTDPYSEGDACKTICAGATAGVEAHGQGGLLL
ncbi:unnamed protein product, partial [Arctogadus glacialis]